MEPLTHFLFGGVLARTGLGRKSALATTTLVLAAEAPDLDVFTEFSGRIYGFQHHRGFTHTFLGTLGVAGFVVLVLYLGYRVFGRRKGVMERPSPKWGVLFWLAVLSGLSHILLDFTNNYGVRPFAPFSYRWYSWDIVFVVEPVLWLILLGALLLPALVKKVIGKDSRRAAALLALLLVMVLWGFRDHQHRRALATARVLTYGGEVPLRVSAFPYFVNPFRWYAVAETRHFLARMILDSRAGQPSPERIAQLRPKPEITPVIQAARRSHLGRVFYDWAQYPVAETEVLDGTSPGYRVHFHDLRFQYPDFRRRPLGGWVQLDQQFRVAKEGFGW